MRNTLVDSDLGDVTSINMPVGQTTPFPGSFTALQASSATISGSLTVTGTVSVGGVAGVLEPVNPTVVPGTTNLFAAAVALTAAINMVTTAAVATSGALVLPSAATWVGGQIAVANLSTQTVEIWPQTNDQIDVLGSAAPRSLLTLKRAVFWNVAAPVGTTTLGQIISMAATTAA
jgi:hypothetical protein